jgi:hypothetical protein
VVPTIERFPRLSAVRAPILLACAALVLLPAAALSLNLDEMSWQSITGGVVFNARFVNDEPIRSGPVTGELNAQIYGAFGENVAPICGFEIPPLPPGGEHTVVCMVPFEALPPSAPQLLPGGGVGCPEDDFWSNGVEVTWDTDDQAVVHRGHLQICPVGGFSFVRVHFECQGSVAWQYTGDCPGFTPDLVDELFNPVGHPLPPGPFDGWMAIDGALGLPEGLECDFDLNLTCGTVPARIALRVVTCECHLPTPAEHSTWGRIKSYYGR